MSDLLRDTLRTGGFATAATTLAVAVCGKLDDDSALAPINAVSHIAWGDEAAAHDAASWKYTAVGAGLNAAAVTSWAAVYHLAFGARARRGEVGAALLGGAAVAGLAYVVDYHVVPKRLTPGFEKVLSGRAMLATYAVLGLSLGIGGLLAGRAGR